MHPAAWGGLSRRLGGVLSQRRRRSRIRPRRGSPRSCCLSPGTRPWPRSSSAEERGPRPGRGARRCWRFRDPVGSRVRLRTDRSGRWQKLRAFLLELRRHERRRNGGVTAVEKRRRPGTWGVAGPPEARGSAFDRGVKWSNVIGWITWTQVEPRSSMDEYGTRSRSTQTRRSRAGRYSNTQGSSLAMTTPASRGPLGF